MIKHPTMSVKINISQPKFNKKKKKLVVDYKIIIYNNHNKKVSSLKTTIKTWWSHHSMITLLIFNHKNKFMRTKLVKTRLCQMYLFLSLLLICTSNLKFWLFQGSSFPTCTSTINASNLKCYAWQLLCGFILLSWVDRFQVLSII